MLSRQLQHPVVSLFLDLDPSQFATAPARATQIRSLLDRGRRELEADGSLDREDHLALREDLDEIESRLESPELPVDGSRALAIFCSRRDDLFETVPLTHSVEASVVIDRTPRVEPLVVQRSEFWCVALVSRRELRVFTGPPDGLSELVHREDDVHGKHSQGGWSQARYQRSYEHDADVHLRSAADALSTLRRDQPFDVLAIGGPEEPQTRLRSMLAKELSEVLIPEPVEVDLSVASDSSVRESVAVLAEARRVSHERTAVERLREQLAAGRKGAAGPDDTLLALHERRVETLLLIPGWDAEGGQCPTCGLLATELGPCPADASELTPRASLREASIEAAVEQDAEVLVLSELAEREELPRIPGIDALLRF
jgi:hypothetical protein